MKDLTLKITWRISSGRFQKTRQRKQTNFLFDDIPLDKYYARKFEHIKLQPCNRHRQTLVIWNRKQEKHNRSNWLLQFSAVFKRPVYNCLCTIIFISRSFLKFHRICAIFHFYSFYKICRVKLNVLKTKKVYSIQLLFLGDSRIKEYIQIDFYILTFSLYMCVMKHVKRLS